MLNLSSPHNILPVMPEGAVSSLPVTLLPHKKTIEYLCCHFWWIRQIVARLMLLSSVVDTATDCALYWIYRLFKVYQKGGCLIWMWRLFEEKFKWDSAFIILQFKLPNSHLSVMIINDKQDRQFKLFKNLIESRLIWKNNKEIKATKCLLFFGIQSVPSD